MWSLRSDAALPGVRRCHHLLLSPALSVAVVSNHLELCVAGSRRRSHTTIHRYVALRAPLARNRRRSVQLSSDHSRPGMPPTISSGSNWLLLPYYLRDYPRKLCQETNGPEPRHSPLRLFSLQIGTFWRADERTRTAYPCSLRVITQALQGVQRLANPAYLGGFLCSGFLRVAPYCAPGGIRVVSRGATDTL